MKTSNQIYKWLRANCGKTCLAVLTHHDSYALTASVNMVILINHSGAPQELFDAYRAIVMQMQPKARYLAYHAIACELDWSHRNMIWTKAGLPEGDKPTQRCQFESGPYDTVRI